jgi:hypothetical protein
MRSRVVEARAPHRIPYFVVVVSIALFAMLMLLAVPRAAQAQAEWNIGPFLGYSSFHGGHPAAAGLQTSVLVGPVGLRVSGFSALDQTSSASYNPADARYGGDADFMLVFDFASRGSGGGGASIAPYVFAGAGMTVHNQTSGYSGFTYNDSRLVGGWSYGGGVLLPIGGAIEAMGEIRARPSGFFNVTPTNDGTRTEYRVGLSLRLGSFFRGSRYRSTPNDPPPPPRPRRRQSDDVRIILGGVSEAAGAFAPAASAARVVPTAEHYLGTPYRYGGTSPITGFDCSGFVQYVFARNAVKLPRTSRQQAKVGSAMPRSFKSLAPGDLVMFAERGEPISHVAIYAGHNRIIHATSSGGSVRYDDLGTPRGQWFVQHMVAARRVTPDGRGLMLDLVQLLDAKTLSDTALDLGDFAPRP